MTVVIDLGCVTHGPFDSLTALTAEYSPSIIYGFDPRVEPGTFNVDGVLRILDNKAAWLFDGEVAFVIDETRSRVEAAGGMVPCFDLSGWLARTFPDGDVFLKMDVEGAEYILLPKMKADGTDALVRELLVEWHEGDRVVDGLRCAVREWWM